LIINPNKDNQQASKDKSITPLFYLNPPFHHLNPTFCYAERRWGNLAKVLGENVAEGGVTLPRFLEKMLQKVG